MTISPGGRDGTEVDALITDRYLDSLLASLAMDGARPSSSRGLDPDVRVVADRLALALPRLHPSFRFEEALAARLTAAAIARRLPRAAGAEGVVVAIPVGTTSPLDDPALAAYLDGTDLDADADLVHPWLIGGALTSAALSLAGAAFVAWRLRRPATPMARAIRAVARTRLA